MSWSHYNPTLRQAERLCIILLPRLLFHVQYNAEYHRSGQTVQADDRNDSGRLVDPRQNQISISQSFRKMLIFRPSSRKRKAMKHSKADHNKSLQSWRLAQRIRKAASRLLVCVHACAVALASYFLSLSASAQCFFLNPDLNYILIKLHVGMFAAKFRGHRMSWCWIIRIDISTVCDPANWQVRRL